MRRGFSHSAVMSHPSLADGGRGTNAYPSKKILYEVATGEGVPIHCVACDLTEEKQHENYRLAEVFSVLQWPPDRYPKRRGGAARHPPSEQIPDHPLAPWQSDLGMYLYVALSPYPPIGPFRRLDTAQIIPGPCRHRRSRCRSRPERYFDHRASLQPSVPAPSGVLVVRGADTHNLDSVGVDPVLGVLVGVTGVASAGESSLIDGLVSCQQGVVTVDQKPIRGSRRTNPTTYTSLPRPDPRCHDRYRAHTPPTSPRPDQQSQRPVPRVVDWAQLGASPWFAHRSPRHQFIQGVGVAAGDGFG